MIGGHRHGRLRPPGGLLRVLTLATALSVIGIGCGDRAPRFAVDDLSPGDGHPLRWNEPIVVRFSQDVDPTSVHPRSVRVLAADGAPVEGRLLTQGRSVTFEPRLIESARLDDGGYPPGGRVTVELPGFPTRTGVRSTSDASLDTALHRELEVVGYDEGAEIAGLCLDVDPTSPPRVLTRAAGPTESPLEVESAGWFVIEFSEPLWPPSIDAAAVRVLFDDPDRTSVPVELRLKQNHDRAEVWVRPAGGFQVGTRYLVDVMGDRVRDLGGIPMVGIWNCSVRGGAGGGPPHEDNAAGRVPPQEN